MSYQFKWSYKKNRGGATWSPPPLPLLEKEEIYFSFFILKFDVLGVSMLSLIFKAWVHSEWPFVRKLQLWFYFVSLISKIVLLLFFSSLDLPDFCRLCCKHFPARLSSLVFCSDTRRGEAGALSSRGWERIWHRMQVLYQNMKWHLFWRQSGSRY